MADGPVSTKLTKKANKATDQELRAVIPDVVEGYELHVERPASMAPSRRDGIWSLYESNMRETLKHSSFGWEPDDKRAEIFHKKSRFLTYSCTNSKEQSRSQRELSEVAAFACFRFEGDPDLGETIREVLYCYELQVAAALQGSGLGSGLVAQLERIGRCWGMERVLLTVLKENTGALRFYSRKGFQIDDTSPALDEAMDYEIMALLL